MHETRDGTSKVIIFFEKWMNPHMNIIHKVMPFKGAFFSADKQRCFLEADTMASGGAGLRQMSAPPGMLLTAVRRCVDYPLCPASLCVWLCTNEHKFVECYINCF